MVNVFVFNLKVNIYGNSPVPPIILFEENITIIYNEQWPQASF